MANATAGDKKTQVFKVKTIDMTADIAYANKPGSYQGCELIYEREYQGQKKVETKNFAGKSLDHPAQARLKAGLASLVKGDNFTVNMEFDGTYWNWKEVTKGGQSAEQSSSSTAHPAARSQPYTPKKDVVSPDNKSGLSDYELGITCGMALNNAVAILGEGAKLDQVEKLGYDFVQMAIRFKENVRTGQFGKPVEVAPNKPQQEPESQSGGTGGDFDDSSDIPF